MKKIPYHQLVIELDKLMFNIKPDENGNDKTEERASMIEAYLISCGWDWNSYLNKIMESEDVN